MQCYHRQRDWKYTCISPVAELFLSSHHPCCMVSFKETLLLYLVLFALVTLQAITRDFNTGLSCVHFQTKLSFNSFSDLLQVSFCLPIFLFLVGVHLIATLGLEVRCTCISSTAIFSYFLQWDGVGSIIQLFIDQEIVICQKMCSTL